MDVNSIENRAEWTERSEYWISQYRASAKPRKLRQRETAPLILCGHGVQMRVDKGSLLIKNGFTHYPQQQEMYRFFRGDMALPPRIVAVDCDGSISFDVIAWLAEQKVALINVDWRGRAVSVLSCDGYAADREKVRWQVETWADSDRRMTFSIELIARKIRNSISTLIAALPECRKRDSAIQKANDALTLLSTSPPENMTALRAIEAICAGAYFSVWRGLTIRWRGARRYPVPEDWTTYKARGSLANGVKSKTMHASHPLNAMLNYAYAMLESRLRIEAVANGFDPTLGIMHQGRRDAAAYIFDLMEPERPKVDASVLAFTREHSFYGADFPIDVEGRCRLSPQLTRTLAQRINFA